MLIVPLEMLAPVEDVQKIRSRSQDLSKVQVTFQTEFGVKIDRQSITCLFSVIYWNALVLSARNQRPQVCKKGQKWQFFIHFVS
jgi:hypothetical protein